MVLELEYSIIVVACPKLGGWGAYKMVSDLE
jgi:hypothetical protein